MYLKPHDKKGLQKIELTQEIVDLVPYAVQAVISQNQVAYRLGIARQRLSDWLKRGEHDMEYGVDSLYARLTDSYHKERAKIVHESLDGIRHCVKNYQSLTWMLERCFREDFGSEGEEIRQLRELFAKILPLIQKGGATDGDTDNGKEKENT